MSAKVLDFVTYRAAHPGSAVRVQVHFDLLWAWKFWAAFWTEARGASEAKHSEGAEGK